MKILFVCAANVFRSPVAAKLLNLKTKKKIADSAGTRKPIEKKLPKHKNLPSGTIKFSNKFGIDLLSHTPRVVKKRQIDSANYILVFDKQNEKVLKSKYPKAAKKIFLLNKFLGYKKNIEIKDLRGTTYKAHIKYIQRCDRLVDKLIKKLKLK